MSLNLNPVKLGYRKKKKKENKLNPAVMSFCIPLHKPRDVYATPGFKEHVMKIPANSLLFTLKFPGRIRNIDNCEENRKRGLWSTT